jgi:hypothetical protein
VPSANVCSGPSRHTALPHELDRYRSKAGVVTSHTMPPGLQVRGLVSGRANPGAIVAIKLGQLASRASLPPHARPAPSKHGRLRLHRLPAEEVMLPRPGVHHAAANAALEATGMRLGVLLPGRGVVHAATRAGEFFDRPDAVGHCTASVFGTWRQA